MCSDLPNRETCGVVNHRGLFGFFWMKGFAAGFFFGIKGCGGLCIWMCRFLLVLLHSLLHKSSGMQRKEYLKGDLHVRAAGLSGPVAAVSRAERGQAPPWPRGPCLAAGAGAEAVLLRLGRGAVSHVCVVS